MDIKMMTINLIVPDLFVNRLYLIEVLPGCTETFIPFAASLTLVLYLAF